MGQLLLPGVLKNTIFPFGLFLQACRTIALHTEKECLLCIVALRPFFSTMRLVFLLFYSLTISAYRADRPADQTG